MTLDLDAIRKSAEANKFHYDISSDEVLALLDAYKTLDEHHTKVCDDRLEIWERRNDLEAERDRLAAENVKLRTALKWYIDVKRLLDHTRANEAIVQINGE